MTRVLKLYWYRRQRNFGDALNELLLPHYGVPVRHSPAPEAEAIGIGSVLHVVPETFGGLILGAGFLWGRRPKRFPEADLRILRGRLTAELCGAGPETVPGDPGLLAGRLLPAPVEKRHTLGLIPQCGERQAQPLRRLHRRYAEETVTIDTRRPPLEVLKAIAACEHIASSALHGLIAADALDIPNVWVEQGDERRRKMFKFRDYYSAFARPERTPLRLTGEEILSRVIRETAGPAPGVEEVTGRMEGVFEGLGQTLRCH